MSGKQGSTATLEQSEDLRLSIPNQIREIMGRKKAKWEIGDSRATESKKLYKQLLGTLKAYCTDPPEKAKAAVDLGWSAAELDNFTQVTGQIKALAGTGKGQDYAQAAEKINEALTVAKSNDLGAKMRTESKTLLAECMRKLQPVTEYLKVKPNETVRKILESFRGRMLPLRQALENFTGDPAEILEDIKDLAEDVTKAAKKLPAGPSEKERASVSPPVQSPEVEKVRAEVINTLDAEMKKELPKCRDVVVKTLAKGDLAKPETAADNAVYAIYVTSFAIVSNQSDREKLPTWDTATDDDRIANVRKRGQLAIQDLLARCKTFRDEFPSKKGQFITEGKQKERENSGQNLEAARKIFENSYKQIETVLGQLADMGCSDLKALRDDCEDMKDNVIKADAYQASDKLIEMKIQKLNLAKIRTTAEAEGELRRLTGALKALRGDLAKVYKTMDASVQTAYKVLMDDADQLSAVLKTGNKAAFKAVDDQVAKIREAGLGNGQKAIVKYVTDSAENKKTATNKDIAKEYSSQANDILLALKASIDNLDLYDLPKSQKEVDTVTTDAKKLVDTWLKLGKWRDGIKKRLEPVAEDRKKLRKIIEKTGDKQDSTFDQDLRSVRDGYNKPGVDTAQIDKILAGLEKGLPPLLKDLAEDPGTDKCKDAKETIKKEQADAKAKTDKQKADVEKKEQAHKAVQERRDAFYKLWGETEKKVNGAPNGDKDELKELKVLYEQVKDKIKAHDDDGAKKQLDSIEPRLKELNANPGGVSSSAMAKLGQVGNNWQKALNATNKSIGDITSEATKVATELGLAAGDITKRSDVLKQKFAGFNFRDSVLALSNEGTPIGDRKKARETALKLLRGLRNVLDNDPELLKFEVNPFKKKNPFKEMRTFASSLEYEALRAVPPE